MSSVVLTAKLTLAPDDQIAVIADVTGLVEGSDYVITGDYLPDNTYFTYHGETEIVLTNAPEGVPPTGIEVFVQISAITAPANYPFAVGDRLVANNLNRDFELSWGPTPPKGNGGGAHRYKSWADNTPSTATPPGFLRYLRIAVTDNAVPGVYNPAEWTMTAVMDVTAGAGRWSPVVGGMTAAQIAAYTPQRGELIFDTTNNVLTIGGGTTGTITGAYLPLAGGTLTGGLVIASTSNIVFNNAAATARARIGYYPPGTFAEALGISDPGINFGLWFNPTTGGVGIDRTLSVGAPTPAPPGGLQTGDINIQRVLIGGTGGIVLVNRNSVLPTPPGGVSGVPLWIVSGNNENPVFLFDTFANSSALTFRRADGTAAAPTHVANNDVLGLIAWRGYGATSYSGADTARIQAFAVQDWTDTARGTSVAVSTVASGATAVTTQATFGPGLTIGTPTAPTGGMLVGDVNATRLLINGLPAGGTITGVTAGTGLTGGGTSGALTLALVTPVAIANGGTGATTASAALASLGGISGNQTITMSGDVTGSGTTAIAATVARLQGRTLASTAPTANQVIQWSGTQWQPATVSGSVTIPLPVNQGGTGDTTLPAPAGTAGVTWALLGGSGTAAVRPHPYWGSWTADASLVCYAAGTGPYLDIARANGTAAAPTATTSGQQLFAMYMTGYGTAWSQGGGTSIQSIAAENYTAAAQGAYLSFITTAPGSISRSETMRLGNTFGLQVNLSTAPLQPTLDPAGSWSRGMCIQTADGFTTALTLDARQDGWPLFVGRTYRGTSSARTAVQSGDTLGGFGGTGHDGTNVTAGSWPQGALYFYAAENWTSTAHGAKAVITLTAPGTTSGVDWLRLGDASANLLNFKNVGVNPPAVTTRSTGTKIVLFDSVSSTAVDYALGIASGTLWFSVPTGGSQFQWYNGTAVSASLTGIGAFSATDTITTGGDFMLGRQSNAWGYLLRPNVAGYRNLSLAAGGANILDTVQIHSTTTNVDGNLNVSNRCTVNDFQSNVNVYVPNGWLNGRNCYITAAGGKQWNITNDNNSIIFSDGTYRFWYDPGAGQLQVQGNLSVQSGLFLNGYHTASADGNYSYFYGPDGNAALLCGNTDACNYYRNNVHQFQSRGGGSTWATIQSNGFYHYVVIYCPGILPNSDNSVSSGLSGQAWAQVASYWFNNVSDQRLKTEIRRPDAGALAQVKQINPVEFHWSKTETQDMPLHRGFLAGDVREVMGERFAGYRRENDVEGLAYHELTAVLWQAVQELAARVETLEGRA